MRHIFLENVKFHGGTSGHSCQGPNDVISMLCLGTASVKVIRRINRLFDRRLSRHIDMPAQSKHDEKTIRKTFHIPQRYQLAPL
jgi:hypothetical protein